MEENKYRKLMVTPAFLEARWRKEINEFTYGRVIPTFSRGERTKERGVVQIEKAPKSSPPRLKHQTTQTSINKLKNIERSATKNEVQESGKVNFCCKKYEVGMVAPLHFIAKKE